MGKELDQHFTLHFRSLVGHCINVSSIFFFFDFEQEVRDLHHFFLAHAHGPGNCLVHEGRRPPRAHKDDPCKLLEIQPHPPRLELNQQDTTPRPLGLQQDLPPLCAVQGAMVELTGHAEESCEKLHLLLKGAEDEELLARLRVDELLERVHLGRGLFPGRVEQLGAHRGLLEPQQDREHELVVARLIGKVVGALEPLELQIERLLPGGLKGEDAALHEGLGRAGRQHGSHGLHGPVDTQLVDERLVIGGDPGHGIRGRDAEEREQRDRILLRVDNGRARDGPLNGDLLGQEQEEFRLLALERAYGMGLVEHDAIPGLVE